MSLPLYGMDKELAEKAAAKYDVNREKEAREWLANELGEPSPADKSFQEYLKDGVVLCRVMLKFDPNSMKKPNVSSMPFKQMENINNFLLALDKLGVPKHDQFQTIDLFESKNMGSVVDTIFAFSRTAVKKGLCCNLLGPKLSDKHEVSFSEEQLNKGKCIIGGQMGFTGGANQSGMTFGARREPTPKGI
ncbi:calponin homology domain-containing protein [Globomyces pollinis-pini]|nr:calponin homology domain-containing protein [Globomyces pollinis-pini]